MSSRLQMLTGNAKFQFFLGIILFFTILGIIGPPLTRSPTEQVGSKYEPPSWHVKLGTDCFGYDVWAQFVLGIRNSLIVGFIVGVIAIMIALLIGGSGAYKGGMIDGVTNTLSNIMLTLPMIPVLIILAALFEQRSLFLVAFILGITGWSGAARNFRSQTLSLKERNFVDLAKITGKSDFKIVFTEVLPNMLGYVFVSFVSSIGGAIMAEAGISMIGLGPTTATTLGSMLHWSIIRGAIMKEVWWWFIPPGIFLITMTGSLISVGSLIDDVLNPKLRGRI